MTLETQYRVHKRQPQNSNLKWMNPVHNWTPVFLRSTSITLSSPLQLVFPSDGSPRIFCTHFSLVILWESDSRVQLPTQLPTQHFGLYKSSTQVGALYLVGVHHAYFDCPVAYIYKLYYILTIYKLLCLFRGKTL
jgi:hypothetical protein